MKHLAAWIACQKGVTAIEYGLIGSGLGFALLVGAFFFGNVFDGMMTTFSDYLTSGDSQGT